MARAFWKGIISFGMVAIPVRLSLATESQTPAFHYLHKKDLVRPKQVLYCPADNEYIERSDTVRGYEYAKDRYVVFDDEDFEKVPVRTSHAIEISAFIKIEEIDLIYYEGSHYLEPEELGVKPFALLRTVLEKTGRVAIAKVAFQRREHLCCLRPVDDTLVLHTLNYTENILPRPDIPAPKQAISDAELNMATKLVEAMSSDFQPEQYHDEYSQALKKMVEAKLQGVEIEAPKEEKFEIEDLMEALKASVAAAGKA